MCAELKSKQGKTLLNLFLPGKHDPIKTCKNKYLFTLNRVIPRLKMRVISQRNNFFEFFKNRYIEFLPTVISYEGLNDSNVLIDPIQLEVWLRQGYGVAIGQTKKGTMILGTVNQSNTLSNIQTYGTRPLTGNDINFFIYFLKQVLWFINTPVFYFH